MNVVRHQDGKVAEPISFLVIVTDGIQNKFPALILAKVITFSWLCTNRYKIV